MSNFLYYLIIIGNTIKMYVNSLYYLKYLLQNEILIIYVKIFKTQNIPI